MPCHQMSFIILRLIDIQNSAPSYSAKVRSEHCMMDETDLREILMEKIALRERGLSRTPSPVP